MESERLFFNLTILIVSQHKHIMNESFFYIYYGG